MLIFLLLKTLLRGLHPQLFDKTFTSAQAPHPSLPYSVHWFRARLCLKLLTIVLHVVFQHHHLSSAKVCLARSQTVKNC